MRGDGNAQVVDADELVAVDPGEVAFGDDGFDVGLDSGEAGEVCFAGGEGLFVEGFEVDGAEGRMSGASWRFQSTRVRWETRRSEAMRARLRPFARSSRNWSLMSFVCMGPVFARFEAKGQTFHEQF
jgi:hypothetical protein